MIYVDILKEVKQPLGWKWKWRSRLFIDTDTSLLELHHFAVRLELKPGWYQGRSIIPRYDISAKHHTRAIALGAMPVAGARLLGVFVRWKKKRGHSLDHKEKKYLAIMPESIDAFQLATEQNRKLKV